VWPLVLATTAFKATWSIAECSCQVHFVEYFDARERWQHIEPGRVSELLAATTASVAVCTCDDSESDNGDLNERLAMFRRRVEDIPLDVAVFLDQFRREAESLPQGF
jgi:hypothetical protein